MFDSRTYNPPILSFYIFLYPSTTEIENTTTSFWKSLEQWQTICYTIREAKRVSIQSDVDEIMIQEAMKQPGPLNLPVHKEDLSIPIQRKIESMEQVALEEFQTSGMDPCLNFQNIISCATSHLDRLKLFHEMIAKERQRLEAKKRLGFGSAMNWDNLLDESFQ